MSADDVLAEHGYELDPEHRAIYFADGLDGVEHDEHSQSRDHYVAWQRERTLAMLAASDVHPGEYEAIVEKLRAGTAARVPRGVRRGRRPSSPSSAPVACAIVVCSNWDWDLREAVAESGLTDAVDAMVSSAWVGARKPHPRIYAAALAEAGVDRAPTSSSWATRGAPMSRARSRPGFRPLYLRRDGHWPDGTAPPDHRRCRRRRRPHRRPRPPRLTARAAPEAGRHGADA